ncbi:MAG: hypothetical protein SO063_11845 [Eubacteriales bacterium]|nr:hypothetical protein [Eubacteriales bacterium]
MNGKKAVEVSGALCYNKKRTDRKNAEKGTMGMKKGSAAGDDACHIRRRRDRAAADPRQSVLSVQ